MKMMLEVPRGVMTTIGPMMPSVRFTLAFTRDQMDYQIQICQTK